MTKSEVTKGLKYDEHHMTARDMISAFSKGKKGQASKQDNEGKTQKRKSLFEQGSAKKVNLKEFSLLQNSEGEYDSDEEDNSGESQVQQVDIQQTFKQDNQQKDLKPPSEGVSTHESSQKMKGNFLLNKL